MSSWLSAGVKAIEFRFLRKLKLMSVGLREDSLTKSEIKTEITSY